MLVNDKLDKQVFQRALSEVKPNSLGIHYGVDDNKIKGVSSFPVFSDYSGIHIYAHPSAEEFIYTKQVGNQYTVGKPAHHAPPSVHSLYDFDADSKMHHCATPHSHLRGIGNSLYGLPDLTINIENTAAREAGVVGITNKQMMKMNWQKEEQPLPDGLEEIINRGSRGVDIEAGESKGESKQTDWDELEAGETKGESKGESKEEYKVRSKGESKGESKSYSRVMAQPAFGFGSSAPKQGSGEERGLELRPLGRIVNDRRMQSEKPTKSFRSPRTAHTPPTPETPRKTSPSERVAKSPRTDAHTSSSLELQKIVVQLSAESDQDTTLVSTSQLAQINRLLTQQGNPKIHGNVNKSVKNILKKINSSLLGEESKKKTFSGLLDST